MSSLRKLRQEQFASYDITPYEAVKKYNVTPDDLLAKIQEKDSPLYMANLFATSPNSTKKVPYYMLRTKDLDKLYELRPLEAEVVDKVAELVSEGMEQESVTDIIKDAVETVVEQPVVESDT